MVAREAKKDFNTIRVAVNEVSFQHPFRTQVIPICSSVARLIPFPSLNLSSCVQLPRLRLNLNDEGGPQMIPDPELLVDSFLETETSTLGAPGYPLLHPCPHLSWCM